MLSLDIIDTDLFLEMPISSRCLYYDLVMRADDDGFVSSPKSVMRTVQAGEDSLTLLAAKGYLIPFESGVCVITDWRAMNKIQPTRKTETRYINELALLTVDETGRYVECRQIVDKLSTQVRLGKVSIEEYNVEETLDDNSLFPVKIERGQKKKTGPTAGWPTTSEQNELADKAVDYLNERKGKRYQKIEANREPVRRVFTRRKAAKEPAPTIGEYQKVIDFKIGEWGGTDMDRHLIPSTLFGPKHFDSYLQAALNSGDQLTPEVICPECNSSILNGKCINPNCTTQAEEGLLYG